MTSKQRWGLIRLFGEFFTVLAIMIALSFGGSAILETRGYEPVPALLKLREPITSIVEIVIPSLVGAFLTRFIVHRRKLSHVVWREPEYVPPEKGGKAPTYAPPLDMNDDILMGSALSSEPEPYYDLHVQPRISRLWWLTGSLTALGAILVIIYGFDRTNVSLGGAITGILGAFSWAFVQEYLLRGLVIAEMRRLTRAARWPIIMSMLLSIPWMVPLTLTASTPTRMLVLLLYGPLLTIPAFALRRMFTTLWAPIVAQGLFISVFLVMV
ncbi:MAG: hypothetical protein Q4D87_04445 [Actinomycetaceae bacterium]|nr:hypothetical protein [Actinomycetaceae bacterium]